MERALCANSKSKNEIAMLDLQDLYNKMLRRQIQWKNQIFSREFILHVNLNIFFLAVKVSLYYIKRLEIATNHCLLCDNLYKSKDNSLKGIKFTQNLSVLLKSINDLLIRTLFSQW